MSAHKSAIDIVKLFGMSNQLIENELDQVEVDFGVDLGRYQNAAGDKDDAYYPQFDQSVRTEAASMAQHYEVFYCLEKTIRNLVSDVLEAEEGQAWWSSVRINPQLQSEISRRMQRELDSGVTMRSTEEIDFTTFGELSEIIKSNKDVFGAVFSSIKAVEKVMASLNTLRGPIAHCTHLSEHEILRLQLTVKDWFRLME